MTPVSLSRIILSATFVGMLPGWQSAAADRLQFNRDIRPILSENCFPCHGPDANHRKADLRLDVCEDAIAARAIVPGNANGSGLVDRINSNDADTLMPPPDSHKILTPNQKEDLRRWITEGADYQKHWAYESPVKPDVPTGQNPVDFLVRRRLEEVKFEPSPEADRRTLLRRLSFDLVGLPPTHEQIREFLQDTSGIAWENQVDRLLQSPHYGERMAIGWLDVVRFADTIGYHSDVPRNVWPYRDWVIQSFNDNKPFDRFTREQIAGDLLPDATQETRVGSAFNRLLLSTEEGGAQPKDYEARMLADRVRAIGTAWLGQTTGCAQCHDHKFDPITSRDFYSLGAFFADIKEAAIGRREDGMPVATVEQAAELAMIDARIAEATQRGDQPTVEAAQKERQALVDSMPKCLVSVSTPNKRTVRILPRGNWMDETGEIVSPAVPHYLPQRPVTDRELDRLDLADWLVSRENPLTARTIMNRLWKQFFGTALSKVPEDLGAQGELPLNPALLDWLACEFMDCGWNMKHMVRMIVTSATYRQVSTVSPELLSADPDNREHARQGRFRLDAELIRDNALSVSGLLVPGIGGPSVKPFQPAGYWENLNFPTRDYLPDSGDAQHRRGLYTWWQRSFLHPSLLAFDAPSREECVAERNRSNIPQQALVLLNDPSYVEAFRALAVRVFAERDSSEEQRIHWIWQQVLQRDPTPAELSLTRTLLKRHRQLSQDDSADDAELTAWTHVARVLLNLHETMTRN